MALRTDVELLLDSPEQLKALADGTRSKILRILQDGPASAKQLSQMLDMTHGKVGHHMKVLRDAGLIEVVETRPVRALTEKFYGLTYDRLTMDESAGDRLQFLFAQAAREALPTRDQQFDPPGQFVTMRLDPDKASEVNRRLRELVEEVMSSERPGGQPFGLVVSLFNTDTPDADRE